MITPYLQFDKKCEEAFQFYKKAFDGEILYVQKYADLPPGGPFQADEAEKNCVLHARLKLKDAGEILGCDVLGEFEKGSSVSISVELADAEYAKRIFSSLKAGGIVIMDLQPSFFAKLHGSVMDKYGFTWMLTVEK